MFVRVELQPEPAVGHARHPFGFGHEARHDLADFLVEFQPLRLVERSQARRQAIAHLRPEIADASVARVAAHDLHEGPVAVLQVAQRAVDLGNPRAVRLDLRVEGGFQAADALVEVGVQEVAEPFLVPQEVLAHELVVERDELRGVLALGA